MWTTDREITQIQDLDDNTLSQSLRGKAPLLLMTAASVLIHALALGILFTTAVNPFPWETNMTEPSVIQVTLSSLAASGTSRMEPIPIAPSSRGTINGENNRKQTEVVIESKQADRSTPKETKQEAPPPVKMDSMDYVMVAVSAVQLTPLSGETTAMVETIPGKPSPEIFSVSDHFPATGEDRSVVKPRYNLTPSPAYPTTARNKGQEGLVLLSVEVLANGRTAQVLVKKSSGYTLLDRSALEAVRSWRFEPAKRKQTPLAMTVDIPIRFSLKND
jgi:TonB family protein